MLNRETDAERLFDDGRPTRSEFRHDQNRNIIGSASPGRVGVTVAWWFCELVQKRYEADVDRVDIQDFKLPERDAAMYQSAYEDMGCEDSLHEQSVNGLLDQRVGWSVALKRLRQVPIAGMPSDGTTPAGLMSGGFGTPGDSGVFRATDASLPNIQVSPDVVGKTRAVLQPCSTR